MPPKLPVLAFDAEAWYRQMEVDAHEDKLDRLAEAALRDHAAGRSTKLRSIATRRRSGALTIRFLGFSVFDFRRNAGQNAGAASWTAWATSPAS